MNAFAEEAINEMVKEYCKERVIGRNKDMYIISFAQDFIKNNLK